MGVIDQFDSRAIGQKYKQPQGGSFVKRARMTSMDTDETKKGTKRGYEGQMIPGIDGINTFAFPQKIITQLRYVDQVQLTSTSGAVGLHVWSMNGIYDPNVTGTGHQPQYFDNYAAIYSQYRVLGSKAIVRWVPNTMAVASSGPAYIGINGTSDTASVSAIAFARAEQNDSQFAVAGLNTAQDGTITQVHYYSPEEKLGLPTGDDTIGAAVTGVPSQQYYIQTWLSDTLLTSVWTCVVEIHYTVEFFKLIKQTTN